ncbi:unnamed protein product, partial [marine sediment metagenome]
PPSPDILIAVSLTTSFTSFPIQTDTLPKNPADVTSGRLGGLKGGKVRAERLSPERRREIAVKAASARWGK